jgi:hypothetical protein
MFRKIKIVSTLIPRNRTSALAVLAGTLLIFFELYFLVVARFGCNADIGLGKYTTDGACYNYLYGYNDFADILVLGIPFLVATYICTLFNFSKISGFFISVSLYIVAILVARVLSFLVLR